MEKKNSSSGITFFGALQVAFIILKLIGAINWSWWMVFIPAYISTALVILLLILAIKLTK